MAGYHGKVITEQFDELSDGDDDRIWVTVRNPRTMAPEELRPKKDVRLNKTGDGLAEDADDADVDNAMNAGNEVCAKLIIGWRVWDSTVPIKLDQETGQVIEDPANPPRLLPSPPSGEDVARAPLAVHEWLGEVMQAATPTPAKTTAVQEAGTSSES